MNAIRILTLVNRIADEIERSIDPRTNLALAEHTRHIDIATSRCRAQKLTIANLASVRRLVCNALARRRSARTGRILSLSLTTWSTQLAGSTRSAA